MFDKSFDPIDIIFISLICLYLCFFCLLLIVLFFKGGKKKRYRNNYLRNLKRDRTAQINIGKRITRKEKINAFVGKFKNKESLNIDFKKEKKKKKTGINTLNTYKNKHVHKIKIPQFINFKNKRKFIISNERKSAILEKIIIKKDNIKQSIIITKMNISINKLLKYMKNKKNRGFNFKFIKVKKIEIIEKIITLKEEKKNKQENKKKLDTIKKKRKKVKSRIKKKNTNKKKKKKRKKKKSN